MQFQAKGGSFIRGQISGDQGWVSEESRQTYECNRQKRQKRQKRNFEADDIDGGQRLKTAADSEKPPS
jgi:hypothetical protein